MNKNIKGYLEDILKYALIIHKSTSQISLQELIQDETTILAIMMAFTIIGEVSKKIPQELRDKYPEIEWKKMAGLRDKIVHEYFQVVLEVLWKTSKNTKFN